MIYAHTHAYLYIICTRERDRQNLILVDNERGCNSTPRKWWRPFIMSDNEEKSVYHFYWILDRHRRLVSPKSDVFMWRVFFFKIKRMRVNEARVKVGNVQRVKQQWAANGILPFVFFLWSFCHVLVSTLRGSCLHGLGLNEAQFPCNTRVPFRWFKGKTMLIYIFWKWIL